MSGGRPIEGENQYGVLGREVRRRNSHFFQQQVRREVIHRQRHNGLGRSAGVCNRVSLCPKEGCERRCTHVHAGMSELTMRNTVIILWRIGGTKT